jgi:hypothetical protein
MFYFGHFFPFLLFPLHISFLLVLVIAGRRILGVTAPGKGRRFVGSAMATTNKFLKEAW